MPNFKPSDVVIHAIPLTDTFFHIEKEAAAAYVVIARQQKDDWDEPLSLNDVANRVLDQIEADPNHVAKQILTNPFINPDFVALQMIGMIDQQFRFTERGFERLARWVPTCVQEGA